MTTGPKKDNEIKDEDLKKVAGGVDDVSKTRPHGDDEDTNAPPKVGGIRPI